MTVEQIEQLFEERDAEFLKFEQIIVKRSQRKDMHAFLLLDELVPGTGCMVDGATHDEIWLGVHLSDLEGKITREQIIELIRCGVRVSGGDLCMFA